MRYVPIICIGNTLVVGVKKRKESITKSKDGRRGKIKEFSERSRMRFLRRLNVVVMEQPLRFLTVTFHDGVSHDEFDKSRKALCDYIRRRGAYGFWKREFQKRGVPHLHFVLSNFNVSKNDVVEFFMKYGGRKGYVWDYAYEQHGIDLRESNAEVSAYVAKYLLKDASFDTRGRYWGVVNRKAFPRARIEVGVARRDEVERLLGARGVSVDGVDFMEKSFVVFCNKIFSDSAIEVLKSAVFQDEYCSYGPQTIDTFDLNVL